MVGAETHGAGTAHPSFNGNGEWIGGSGETAPFEDAILADGFESGDTAAWSATAP